MTFTQTTIITVSTLILLCVYPLIGNEPCQVKTSLIFHSFFLMDHNIYSNYISSLLSYHFNRFIKSSQLLHLIFSLDKTILVKLTLIWTCIWYVEDFTCLFQLIFANQFHLTNRELSKSLPVTMHCSWFSSYNLVSFDVILSATYLLLLVIRQKLRILPSYS